YEDNVRATYGLEWEINRPNLKVNMIVGQSYRLANNNNIVPDGTGLSERFSDIVGRTNVRFKDIVKFTHRFRLDKDNLAVRRNEIDATIGSKGTYAQVGYLRLNRNIGSQLEDLRDREEIRVGGRYQVDKYWSVFGSAIVDLTDRSEDPLSIADGYAPVRHRLGVAYDDGCLSMGVTWRYDYEDTGDARRGSTFLFRLALRNLGV
ncbi:LPS assembly protein LptD, partial [Parasphingorhabdus sp.]